MQGKSDQNKENRPIKELTNDEVSAVSGGFFGVIVAVLAALATAGCATMPNRGREQNN